MTHRSPTPIDGVIPFVEESTQRGPLPNRYSVKEDDKGRFLTCVEAPNVAVRIERDFTVSATGAHKYPECTIFLDGAARAEPFMDVKRKIYNLDHHEGCVRAFTLATCEQAMVMILKGLDLDEGDWSVYGNEPDLDTVLSVWVLLNHVRLTGDAEIRSRSMPLLRLQGAIDAHGFELRELCGLPEHLQDETEAVINVLRREEVDLKKAGKWQSTDLLEFTASVLRSVDKVIYSPRHFEDLQDVEERVRFPVAKNRIGIVCKADIGVYAVEEYLKKLHKERVGLFALQTGSTTYTLKLVDSFLPKSLEPIYDRLNQLEPNLSTNQRWGGSADIGGSPRGIGTALNAQQIARICERVFRPEALRRRLSALASAAGLAGLAVILAVLVAFRGLPSEPFPGTLNATGSNERLLFGATLFVLSFALLIPAIRARQKAQTGLRLPTSIGWLVLLPVVAVAALGRGGWGPPPPPTEAIAWVGLLVGALAVELLFRGAIHGRLMALLRVVRPGGAWSISVPNAVAALLYSAAMVLLFFAPISSTAPDVIAWEVSLMAVSALVMGLVCGLARERSGSLLPPITLHLISVALVSVGLLLFG